MLDIRFPVDPDEHGVIDGLELASLLIYTAVNLTVPYVVGCPACLDTAFEKLANRALDLVHQDLKRGKKTGHSYVVGLEGEERRAAIGAHLLANLQSTKSLLEGADKDHH